ncbi:Dissimilatory sulfite reductase D (DsrD) [Sporotomaculum syntrophicum]|uniref:Dissimilatory sulfite reductase D (DsrD) n=1 Tax=Sporotomaculum syntrophicum TaxID=182264 RepID=A0A9D3AYY6_9FIRM|nr:dissimilatory sulfite reductase D family protein [Sporotomaculum syntrophicum]KAF1085976.1 Dissimilatory sulfite reductase D (DsrD) [Sporotomaculum syntrophicum]
MDELKKIIVEFAETNMKTKFYFKDIEKAVRKVNSDVKMRDVKKACTALINEGTLIYFSTGSSTMYGLKGRGMTEDPEP